MTPGQNQDTSGEVVNQFEAGSLKQRRSIILQLSNQHRFDSLKQLLPAIATTLDASSRQKQWSQLAVVLHRERVNLACLELCEMLIDEVLEEPDAVVREAVANRLISMPMLRDRQLVLWLARRGKLNSLISLLQQTKSYDRYKVAETLVEVCDERPAMTDGQLASACWELAAVGHSEGIELASGLLLKDWFWQQLCAANPGNPLSLILTNPPSDEFIPLVLDRALDDGLVHRLIQNDQFKWFEPLMESVPREQQTRLVSRARHAKGYGNWAYDRNNVKRLLQAFYEVKNETLRFCLAEHVACSSVITKRNGDLVARYVSVLTRNDETKASYLCLQMLRTDRLHYAAIDSPLVAIMLTEIKRPNLQHLKILLAKSSNAANHVAEAGHAGDIIEAVYQIADVPDRVHFQRQLLAFRSLQDAMSAQQISELFAAVLDHPEPEYEIPRLLTSHSAVSKLIELGHLDQLRDLADASTPSIARKNNVRWRFYCHGDVVRELRERNESSQFLLEMMKQADQEQLRKLTYRLGYDGATAFQWILQEHSWAVIDEQIDRLPQGLQDSSRIRLLTAAGAQLHYVESQELAPLLTHRALFAQDSNARSLFFNGIVRRPGFAEALESPHFTHQLATLIRSESDPRIQKMLMSIKQLQAEQLRRQ